MRSSSRFHPLKAERKLLQAAATGQLSRLLLVLEKNGKYLMRKKKKQERRAKRQRRRTYSDLESASSAGSGSDSDEPSTTGRFRYEYEPFDEVPDLASKKSKRRKSSRRKTQQSDALREALVHVDINCVDAEGLTPLHHACYADSLEMVEFLLSKGADVSAQDARGNTPLHIAARLGFTDVIAALRDAGGDMHVPNYDGVTPLIAVEARIERLRTEKEEKLNPKKRYMEPQDWGTRLEEELSGDEGLWGHSWGEPQPKRDWWREDWSEFLYKDEDDGDDQYAFLGPSRKRKPKDPLEGGLFKELNAKRKQAQEEKNREAKRILEEEMAKDKAWRERVLQKKSVDRNSRYESAWKKFTESCNLCLSFSDVPFPVETGKEAELSRVILHNAPPSDHKQLVRKEILRWHPDKFLQKYCSRLQGPDHDRILARVNEISQALHQLYSSV